MTDFQALKARMLQIPRSRLSMIGWPDLRAGL